MMYWKSITELGRRNWLWLLPGCILSCFGLQAQSSFGEERRAELHRLIDSRQTAIDLFDHQSDRVVELGNNRDTELASKVLFDELDELQYLIENSGQDNLEKYNDLVGVYNQVVSINERNIHYIASHARNIRNAAGIIRNKLGGTLGMYLYRHMLQSLNNVTLFKDEAIAEQFLQDAAGRYPGDLFKAVASFQKEAYAERVIEHAAKLAPNTAKRYFPTKSPINHFLVSSEDSAVWLLLEIYRKYGLESKAFFFLEKVAESPDSMGYYSFLEPGSEDYLKALIDIRRRTSPMGAYSLDRELEIQSLRYIRPINDMHLMKGSEDRFASVEAFDTEQLYTLMVYSPEEIFTSTYNGIFNRLLLKLEEDSTSGYALLETMHFNRFRTFIRLAAGYNTLGRFLQTMSAEQGEQLFRRFVQGLGADLTSLDEAVHVADTFGSLEDLELLRKLYGFLVADHQRLQAEGHRYGEVVYSLLLSLLAEKMGAEQLSATTPDAAELPVLDRLGPDDLAVVLDTIVQQHFFFDDDDGIWSFGSFLNDYRNNEWLIADSQHYVIISSASGRPVRIYANKPLSERTGQQQLRELFDDKGMAPSVVVHRGHSYYVHITVDHVRPETRMVFLGSCGGYHQLSQVIERSPEVHIISSKQIGTAQVNNALLYAISEILRSDDDLVWSALWAAMEENLREDQKAMDSFEDYIPPHRNLGAIFLQAYYRLTG